MSVMQEMSVFGEWTVISFAGTRSNYAKQWLCRCSCGRERIVQQTDLRRGQTTNCGCKKGEALRERNRRHGDAGPVRSPEYVTWTAMKNRCTNRKHPDWAGYGGAGITVCDRWLHSYEAFLADMGRRPSHRHSIDRIDNGGNYEPGNCRWATPKQQANNRKPRPEPR